jgi:hypothetical protein
MGYGEDANDTLGRLLAGAALVGGIGAGLYKGYKGSPKLRQQIAEVATGAVSMNVPRVMTSSPVEFQQTLFQEAFDAADDIMGPGGKDELMSRAYNRALYGAGIVTDEDRRNIVEELVKSSRNWGTAKKAIEKYQPHLGGFEGIYSALREISGGTIKGYRRKEVGQLIRQLPSLDPDPPNVRKQYTISDFGKGGQFWRDRFGLKVDDLGQSRVLQKLPLNARVAAEKHLTNSLGGKYKAVLGIRESNRPRLWQTGHEGIFKFPVPGDAQGVVLPYTEFRIMDPDDFKKNKWFLQVPEAVQHRGSNFVAADHRGMSYASVPHFAVPIKGGASYKKVSWNEGISIMLYGDESNKIEGLAQKLHKLHGDSKAMRDLTWSWNTQIRGLFHQVTGSQANMTQSFMHSQSILPIDKLLNTIAGTGEPSSIEGLTNFYTKMKESGLDVGPLGGVDAMGDHYRIALKDWGKRWDIFGEGYSIERRYGSRVKPFVMTQESIAAMEQAPIGGILKRGYGITATAAAREEMQKMPQVVAYLSIDEALDLSPEEAVISKKLAPMMKMTSSQKVEVLKGTTQASRSELLKKGAVIGVDYRTGKTILAEGIEGQVEQRIVSAGEIGDITRLEIETQLPLQDKMKMFGFKAQVHQATGGIENQLIKQYGAGAEALRFKKDIEFIGQASLMKNIPQEINKQMAEATWLIMQKRLSDANLLRSGGKGKIKRQEAKKLIGQKTYTYKGGLPKNYVNMDMWMYVRDQQYKDKILKNRQIRGTRLAKRLGLKGEQEALGVGLEMLKYAKKHNLDQKELGLIGGAFYKQLEDTVSSDLDVNKLLKQVGLTEGDISALKSAKGVLAMPTMYVGDYASYTQKWGRAGMDYRALMELKAQRWGPTGEMLLQEIARRVIPTGSLEEMERAALSVVGKASELPEGIEKISKIAEAREAIGQKPFLFEYGGKEIYVPSSDVKGMGQFPAEVGDIKSQDLRRAYEGYFKSQEAVKSFPGPKTEAWAEKSFHDLQVEVHKQYIASGSLKGKVIGTSGPIAERRVLKQSEQQLSRTFSNIDEFLQDPKRVFTTGITRETGTKMFRDLISKGSPEEVKFLKAQQIAFLKGEKVSGFMWRHPTIGPQSLMPTWMELVEGKGESAQFYKLQLKHGERVLDVSQAAGMKLDYDFDHVQLGIIADEKVKVAIDGLLNSTKYKKGFIESLTIQHDIQARVKAAAIAGEVSENVPTYVKGLQRLIGVKMETGVISNLVGDMRAAAAFQAGGREFTIASHLFEQLEQGPISSKHGLLAGDVKKHLQEFVTGEGTGVRDAMRNAWDILFKEGEFTADKIKYSREEFIDMTRRWVSDSKESGDLAAFRNIARAGAQAQEGKEWQKITTAGFARVIDQFQGGRGDLNAALSRSIRMGPGSAISKSRAVVQRMGDIGQTALQAFKKHWKYPAIGTAVALGISSVLGGNDLEMPDHSDKVTSLGQGPGVPRIAPPAMHPGRIVTSGGSGTPSGFGMHEESDYSSYGMRQLGQVAQELNSDIRIRDNRGAITPEYIQKAQRERYY